MKIEDHIKEVDKHIDWQKRGLVALEDQRSRIVELSERYPDAHWINGTLCLQNIWPNITRMRITRKTKLWPTTKIIVRFLTPEKFAKDLNVYAYPYEQDIATIHYDYQTNNRDLKILDYTSVIPDSCPKKNSFIKRIKQYLIQSALYDNLTLNDQSYNIDEFAKHLILA